MIDGNEEELSAVAVAGRGPIRPSPRMRLVGNLSRNTNSRAVATVKGDAAKATQKPSTAGRAKEGGSEAKCDSSRGDSCRGDTAGGGEVADLSAGAASVVAPDEKGTEDTSMIGIPSFVGKARSTSTTVCAQGGSEGETKDVGSDGGHEGKVDGTVADSGSSGGSSNSGDSGDSGDRGDSGNSGDGGGVNAEVFLNRSKRGRGNGKDGRGSSRQKGGGSGGSGRQLGGNEKAVARSERNASIEL